jgi:hypothetical protein
MVRGFVRAGLILCAMAVVVPTTAVATAAEVAAPTLVAVDRARAFGLRATDTETYSATPVDYNRDGRQDVWIGYHGFGSKLWRNRARQPYKRVATSAWPRANEKHGHIDRHDCDWADVDGNGLPDAYCSTGRMIVHVVKYRRDNELWLQVRPGRFREVGTAWGVGDLCGRGRDVTFINANGDRFPDVFVGNETPRKDPDDPCNVAANHLPNERSKIFINVHGDRFRYVKDLWNFGPGIGIRCSEAMDFDGDGWQDLLACGEPGNPLRLYRNRRGHGFADVTARQPLGSAVFDATVVDLDRDGDKDVVTATSEGFDLHLNTRGSFGPATSIGRVPVGQGGRSVAVGDADGDGDYDVYGMVGQGFTENPDDQIWINTGGLRFQPISVPSATGSAGKVVALTPRAGRRAGFLVLNGFGRYERGPVQFIQVFSR